jgi:hypothetical protein
MDNELLTIGSEEGGFWYRYKPSQCDECNGTVDRIAADAEAVPCEMGVMHFEERKNSLGGLDRRTVRTTNGYEEEQSGCLRNGRSQSKATPEPDTHRADEYSNCESREIESIPRIPRSAHLLDQPSERVLACRFPVVVILCMYHEHERTYEECCAY